MQHCKMQRHDKYFPVALPVHGRQRHTSFCAPAAANLIFISFESNFSLKEKTSASLMSLLVGLFLSNALPFTMLKPINAGFKSSFGICVTYTTSVPVVNINAAGNRACRQTQSPMSLQETLDHIASRSQPSHCLRRPHNVPSPPAWLRCSIISKRLST